MTRVLKQAIFLAVACSLVSCGAWLGNPKDFSDNDEKKNKQPAEASFQVYAAIVPSSAEAIVVRGKDGQQADAVQLTQIQLRLKTLQLSDGVSVASLSATEMIDFSTQPVVNLGTMSSTLGTVSRVQLDWQSEVSLVLAGRYKDRDLKVSLSLDNLDFRSALPQALSGAQAFLIEMQLERTFDFTGQAVDFEAIAGSSLDLDTNSSEPAVSLKNFLATRVLQSFAFGFDRNGDQKLDQSETFRDIDESSDGAAPSEDEQDSTGESPVENPDDRESDNSPEDDSSDDDD